MNRGIVEIQRCLTLGDYFFRPLANLGRYAWTPVSLCLLRPTVVFKHSRGFNAYKITSQLRRKVPRLIYGIRPLKYCDNR